MKLIVTESDSGDSLELPGQWSCESVDHDDSGNSITEYRFEQLSPRDKRAVETALNNALGVVTYEWQTESGGAREGAGRPSSPEPLETISVTLYKRQIARLGKNGANISARLRELIDRSSS